MKITQESIEKGQELFQQLVKKAWGSASFKEQLILDPKSVITEISGRDFIQLNGKEIIVEDQTNSNFIYLNIPKKISLDSYELTEDQLEAISGGGCGCGPGGNPFEKAGYYTAKALHDFDMWLGKVVFG